MPNRFNPVIPVLWLLSLAGAFTAGLFFVDSSGEHPSPQLEDRPDSLAPPASPEQATDGSAPAVEGDTLAATFLPLSEYLNGETVEAEAVMRAIKGLNATQSLELLAQAFELPEADPMREQIIRSLLLELARADPSAALGMAASIGSVRERESATSGILELWAKRDPVSALSWVADNSDALPFRLRSDHMSAAMRGFAQNDPAAAFTYANGLGEATQTDRRLKSRLLEEIITIQMRDGQSGAVRATIELMPEGPVRDELMNDFIQEWAALDPGSAAAYVNALGESAKPNLKTSLARAWAAEDPEAAAAWIASLGPEDPSLGPATVSLIQEWSRYDLNAPASWLNELPGSPELDRAVAIYTYRAAEEDPAGAMTWAESISREGMKSRMMQRVASLWKESDPQAFQTYLDSAQLDEATKQALQNAEAPSGVRWGWGRGL